MEDVTSFFNETCEAFTIYVVEQRFAVGRGADYFRSFKGKDNLISNNANLRKQISSTTKWISKSIPALGELVNVCFGGIASISIVDAITALNKLFTVHEHQAAGPNVLDPIIIEEKNILPQYLAHLIALHENSILQPTIIVLLKDNNFERAKELLSSCPNGINIKFIRNSGETEILKVVNRGAKSADEFLTAYASQCFSTCSKTTRSVLLSDEWAKNSVIEAFAPSLMKLRTNMLFEEKNVAKADADILISSISSASAGSDDDAKILRSFEFMAKLCRVWCNDAGNADMEDMIRIASDLNNEILRAHAFRYAYFIPNLSSQSRSAMYKEAEKIFTSNGMMDHAFYCRNNALFDTLSTKNISLQDFRVLQEEAINNVPGLVGMSHILNNTGVAHLLKGDAERACEYFSKGLDYAKHTEKNVQKIGIECNLLIAKAYQCNQVAANECHALLRKISDSFGTETLPFISARYAMNVIAIAYSYSNSLANELLDEYPIATLVQRGIASNKIGSGQLLLQFAHLSGKHTDFTLDKLCIFPAQTEGVSGSRKDFIEKYGFNPIAFKTWL